MEQIYELQVPDIGDFENVPIVELLVQIGDTVTCDTPVVTLESDKASMEVPAEVEGVITEILVEEGDTVFQGTLLLRYTNESVPGVKAAVEAPEEATEEKDISVISTPSVPKSVPQESPVTMSNSSVPASPSVRRLARELGVELSKVVGTGRKGRLKKDDVLSYVKTVMQNPEASGRTGLSIKTEPLVDFSVFGKVEKVPLSRIKKLSGTQLTKNWAAIPHVTSCDDADITDLEDFRKQINMEQSVKLTLLPFLIKAVQYALKAFPALNSSLQGDDLIIKHHYHIGFAVDTPIGLLVPVIREVDTKGLLQIATEVAELAALARDGRLKREQMQGGTFTISSLGSAGGTYFTPIINSPEAAILALGRAKIQPQWDGSQFIPRMILPLSLSWDHRILDGVTGSKFNVRLREILADLRRITL